MALVFNVSKGKVAHYASLPGTNDALVAIPLETAGIEADAILQDYDTVAALLAGASNEQTTLGRVEMSGVTVTVNDTDNRVEVDADDVNWPAGSGNPCSRMVIAYDPDTTSGSDADLVPLVLDNFVVTPTGSSITYQVATGGFYHAA